MLAADMRAFENVLGPQIEGIAHWATDSLKAEGLAVTHHSLGEALTEEFQAFLRITDNGTLTGPRIQYLRTNIAGGSRAGPQVGSETPDAFVRAGWLAFFGAQTTSRMTSGPGFVESTKVT